MGSVECNPCHIDAFDGRELHQRAIVAPASITIAGPQVVNPMWWYPCHIIRSRPTASVQQKVCISDSLQLLQWRLATRSKDEGNT